ncbi:dynein regulatory complex subunit 4 isoform X2 [Pimephales promelas]|uniref:dynein regulatory complex subunit 4 isoform X2 n=1 Tax=Pimephales promelas TaxID=90988 RepID=UPI001955B399|nr:dynein regulatory complex subunit 4 isoform X2 [Pimephales promelas]KAG1946545.1 dynein regulatory complex subunit [Pimephales promelas]
MPPKKKSSNKSPKGRTPTVVDGLSTEEMSKEQLEEHIVRLREELDREREERNYFQLERDKIHTFWEITRRQLEENKYELRNRERDLEEAEKRHQVEIKVYKQKVKHLLYEQQNMLSELKAESVVSTKQLEKENAMLGNHLQKDMHNLKVYLKEQELSSENVLKSIHLKHDEEITDLRKDFARQVREIGSKYEKRMQKLRQEEELRRKTDIHEIEERKNSHINMLMKNHEKAFKDIRNYFNDIVYKNLDFITSLKEELKEMKRKEEKRNKEMAEVLEQNKDLRESPQKAKDEVAELQKQLDNYEKDKSALTRTRARLKIFDRELKELKWEHKVLEQRFTKVQLERDELYMKFTKTILEVQQKSGFKNLLLECKLSALNDTLEKKEAQLSEVLSVSNLDPTILSVVTHKLEAYDDLLKTSEAKLRALGIPVEELSFKPLETNIAGQSLGRGLATVVSSPN